MRYDHSVVYNGRFYRAGEEVPMSQKQVKENTEVKKSTVKRNSSKKPDSENETDRA